MEEFPLILKKGGSVAKIYLTENRGKTSYGLVWHTPEGRHVRNFRLLEDARREAKDILGKLARGQNLAASLTNRDAAAYAEAADALRPSGMSLMLAAKEYAEAVKVLAGKGSVLDAARDFSKSNRAKEPKLMREVVDAFLAKKKKKSERYLRDMKGRLDAFATTFAGYIGNITTDEVGAWLRRIGGSPRTFNNYRNALVTLFRFAKKEQWLDETKITAVERVDREDDEGKDIEIFTPEEMRKLLAAAPADLMPWLLLGGFAGVRTEEVCRLDWKDVHLREEVIEILTGKAKTRRHRLIPLAANLAAWLKPITKKSSGLVFKGRHPGDHTKALSKRAGVVWKVNALRHSFISYRMALVKDEHEVAIEAGNSPAMIYANYRKVLPDGQATQWFGIMPPAKVKKKKIVQIPKQKVA